MGRKKSKQPFHCLCKHQQYTIPCNHEVVYTYEIIWIMQYWNYMYLGCPKLLWSITYSYWHETICHTETVPLFLTLTQCVKWICCIVMYQNHSVEHVSKHLKVSILHLSCIQVWSHIIAKYNIHSCIYYS